jgi:uncharacterized membrane protein YphA (DoxX/SURF4 family)
MSLGSGSASHPALSHADRFAIGAGDVILLVGRVLLGWLFFVNGWAKLTNNAGFVGYLTNLKVPAPGFWSWIAALPNSSSASRLSAFLFVTGAGRFSLDWMLGRKR